MMDLHGTIDVAAGLRYSVTIIRDRYGIPHIYGQSVEDVVCALGYVHATDRLWQMDMSRRRAQGRLAELLGESAFEQDLFCRTLGLKRAAERCLDAMQKDGLSYRCLEAYCRGVNARVERISPDRLSRYFKALGYDMEPWCPIDTLSYMRYIAWTLSGSFDDLWLLTAAHALGGEVADELYPFYRPYEIPVVPDRKRRKQRKLRSEIPGNVPGLLDAAQDVLERARRTGFQEESDRAVGSNSWAVDGTKSATGKPILCNDPHLGFSLPSVWYLAHLAAEDLNVVGGTFPGIPVVFVGRNDHIAWGVTSLPADVVDFFFERVHPRDESKYRHRARWHRFETVEEEFVIRGAGTRKVAVEFSVHGPVLTRTGRTITMQWAGYESSDEVETFLKLDSAKNLDDFRDALRSFGVPPQNFAYADKDGNIAICSAGKFPVRRHGLGRVPHDGASGRFDWQGYVPFRKLRYLVNPDRRYVASANQRPVGGSFPYYLGWQWADGYRARRIGHLLSTNESVSVEDMERFQCDVHDCAAESFLPALFTAFEEEAPGEITARALTLLKAWDCKATPESVATSIWANWFLCFREAVWAMAWREAGGEGGRATTDNPPYPPTDLLEWVLREEPEDVILHGLNMPEGEALEAVLRESFRKAVENLVITLGADMHAWKWGRLNRGKFASLAETEELSRKDVPLGGTAHTLNPGDLLGEVTAGAGLRFIASFDRPEEALVIYPGGQSEEGASPHYADLMDAWIRGDYVKLVSYEEPQAFPKEQIESATVLNPG